MGITNPALDSGLQGLSGAEYISRIVPALISFLFIIGCVAFILYMGLGGIQWITSGGDKVAHEQAKGRITNAVIGLFILFSLYAIIDLAEEFFGVNLTSFDLSDLGLLQGSQGPNDPGPP